jgi:hypothetical protein
MQQSATLWLHAWRMVDEQDNKMRVALSLTEVSEGLTEHNGEGAELIVCVCHLWLGQNLHALIMSGAGKKIFKNSRFVIQKNKENLSYQLDDIRLHCTIVKLLLMNLISSKSILNITHTLLCWYNFKYNISKNSLVSGSF